MLIGIIIGIPTMSLFSTLVCFIVPNEQIVSVLVVGPIGWFVMLIDDFFRWLRYHNRKQIIYNKREKKYYYCDRRFWFNPSELGEDWTWASVIPFQKFAKTWGKRFSDEENVPSMRYAPKKVWKNFDPLPKELLDKITEDG